MLKLNSCFILIVVAAFYLTGCGEDPPVNNTPPQVDTSTFTYPFTIGSTWSYNRTFSAENIRPDSIRHYFTNYPFHSTGNITIVYDTVINGNTARCFHEKYTEVQGNDTMTWNSRYYYGSYDTALVCFAYRPGGGGSGMPYLIQSGIKFSKYGKTFNNVNEAFHFIEYGNNMPFAADSLYIEQPPGIALKYPIVTNTEWICRYIQGTVMSRKKYLSFNIEYIGGIPVSCVKTEKFFTQFNDMICYDYHSKYGQVKRDYLIKDLAVTDPLANIIGYVDIRDLYNITSYNIVNP